MRFKKKTKTWQSIPIQKLTYFCSTTACGICTTKQLQYILNNEILCSSLIEAAETKT